MQPECETISLLKRYASPAGPLDPSLAGVAGAALNIVHEVRGRPIPEWYLDWLSELIDALCRDGQEDMLCHLQQGVADCDVCAALAGRLPLKRDTP